MRAKEYLSRAYCIELQVQSKMQQLEVLKSLACRMSPVMKKDPVRQNRNTSALQDTIVKILEAEEELNRKVDELVDMKLEIAQTIDLVEEMSLRVVLERRYLQFMSWQQIREEMNYSQRWVQQQHRDALEAVQEILDAREAEREGTGDVPEI